MSDELPITGVNKKRFDLELVGVNHAANPANRLEVLTKISAEAWRTRLEELPVFINRGGVSDPEAKLLEHYCSGYNLTIQRHPSVIFDDVKARQLAAEPSTTPRLLARLTRSGDRETRRLVARNPNISKSILFFLAEEFPEDFLQNPCFGLLQIESPDLLEKLPASLVKRLLGLSPLPSFLLGVALGHHSPHARAALAAMPALPPAALEQLLSGDSPVVLSALASRTDLSQEQQQRLAKEPAAQESLAKNPSTRPSILRGLSNAQETQVCIELAKNPKITPAIQRRLAGHRSASVREALAQNQALAVELLREFAGSTHERFRSVAARHPNTPVECLCDMAANEGIMIKLLLTQNPSTPVALLQQFITQGPSSLLSGVITNPNIPNKDLRFLLQSKSKRHKALLAQRKDLNPSFFEVLIKDSSVGFEVRAAMASNPALPEAHMEILVQEGRAHVQQQLTHNPALPKRLLYQIAQPTGGKNYEYAAIEKIFSGMVPGVTLDRTA